VNTPRHLGPAVLSEKAVSGGEKWADMGRPGMVGLDPRKNSMEKLNFEFQLNLEFG
jgi:hypothetical protein